jgi:GTP cyclohydrolase I
VVNFLEQLGEDPTREGLSETPNRVIKSWKHLYSGYQTTPEEVLKTRFREQGCDGIVLLRSIEMYSTCEHHLLPFVGIAHVGYRPKGGRIVGLSKLARLVEVFSRRLQNQERLSRQIAEALENALDPEGVGVVIEAEHFCMRARGVEKQQCKMVTTHWLGCFEKSESERTEMLRLMGY